MSLHLPRTLAELWPLLDEPGAALLAGGTDLLVRRRATGARGPLCGLDRLDELQELDEADNVLRIGAATPLSVILRHPVVAKRLPVLREALRMLGSPLIRNQASLGGNLCTASPAGDSLPALLVLDAELELASRAGRRTLRVEEFLLGPGRTALAPGEIVLAVRIALPAPEALQHFEKVGRRQSLAIAVASLAALLRLEGGLVREARLALGSMAPTAMRCPEAESALLGRPLDRSSLEDAARAVRAAVRPIDDVRASAEYRRQVAGNLLLRLLPQG